MEQSHVTNENQGKAVVDCYIRASALVEALDDTIERLREYEQQGAIDELSITIWPDRIRLTEETEKHPILDSYGQFREWAEDNDVSLEPAFKFEKRTTLVCDTPEPVLNLPALCLGIRLDGDLVTVVPHSTETGTYTIGDALADIETNRSLSTLRSLEDSDTTVREVT